VYDVAEGANAEVFPNATNLSSVAHLLPDLREYLLSFDYDSAITSAATSSSTSDFLTVLEMDSYRQFGWCTTAYFLLAAALFALLFISHVMWTFCCFKCGCRRRNPLAKPKIYSKLQKIVWGTLMMLFLFVSAAAAVMTFFEVHNVIKPLAASAFTLLNETLPSNLTAFETNFLSPMDGLLANGYRRPSGESFFLFDIQERSRIDLEGHTFLDKQSYNEDVIGTPIFDLLSPLTSYSSLYPTTNDDSIDCEDMNITQPSVKSRMTIGGRTGCFKCKTCLSLVDMIQEAKASWRKHIFEVQIDMRTAKEQLKEFSLASGTLTPAIQQFADRMHAVFTDFRVVNRRIAAEYEAIAAELGQTASIGLYALCGLCGLSVLLGAGAFVRGVLTGRRKLGRATCFFTEIAFLAALVMIGVLYTASVMTQDAIVALQRFNENTFAFVPSNQLAEDVRRLLFDQNFVEATRMIETLEFSDTLRVPPHPTPATDNPGRFNFAALYDMPTLFALESLTSRSDEALVELFAWSEEFATDQYKQLKELALVDSEVATPYNGSLHQTLLNSTLQQLMDPDSDGELVTADDILEIQAAFNESWRGLGDAGVARNEAIQTQWLVVAQLYYQKQKLETYAATVSSFISQIHPLLGKFFV
jgi:hypothetical protein